jgi:aminoglycoside phosphotransferase (APT) family kinase protein
MNQPDADVVIDEALVRGLLDAQHPEWRSEPLVYLDAGWDNAAWRLGDDLLVRLPRRDDAAALIVNEQRWLPEIAEGLPLEVPLPVATGTPGLGFPYSWSVVPWLDGVAADVAELTEADESAERFGAFLTALHQPAPPDAPQNPYRGGPLEEKTELFVARANGLSDEVDVEGLAAIWAEGLQAPVTDVEPAWLHGDLHPGNLLVNDGILTGVIDFGDLCQGDPATDLAGAWLLFEPNQLGTVRSAAGGIDDATWARTRAWAAFFGLIFTAIGMNGRPSYEVIGRRTLTSLLSTR